MVEDEAVFAGRDEILEAGEAGDDGGAAGGHGFEGGEAEGFAFLGERWINEHAGGAVVRDEGGFVEDTAGEFHAVGDGRGGVFEFREMGFAAAAVGGFPRADDFHAPVRAEFDGKTGEGLDEEADAFFRMHAADVEERVFGGRDFGEEVAVGERVGDDARAVRGARILGDDGVADGRGDGLQDGVAVELELALRVARDVDVGDAALAAAGEGGESECIRDEDIGGRQVAQGLEAVPEIAEQPARESRRRSEAGEAFVADAAEDFARGELRMGAGKVGDLVALADEFLAEGEPDFFNGAAEDGGNGQEGTLDDGDAHEVEVEGWSGRIFLTAKGR